MSGALETVVVWVVEYGVFYEGGSNVGCFSSYELAYTYAKNAIEEELAELLEGRIEGDPDSWYEPWEEVKDNKDRIIEFYNDDEFYRIFQMPLEGKPKYVESLEKALLYTFPGGDLKKILDSVKQSMKDSGG